jgi:hypothetical protein
LHTTFLLWNPALGQIPAFTPLLPPLTGAPGRAEAGTPSMSVVRKVRLRVPAGTAKPGPAIGQVRLRAQSTSWPLLMSL